jgi:hypothetical protein
MEGMMQGASIAIRACAAIACSLAVVVGWAAPAGAADDLCGRPRETPDSLFERLTKAEKLAESFRDKAYVVVNDAGNGTLWTFTLAGHPAHPSVVCRQPVEDGGKLRMDMGVQCEAAEAECERLVRGFEDLNQKMLKELERQGK